VLTIGEIVHSTLHRNKRSDHNGVRYTLG